jgi:hypothetical protein
VTIATRPSYRRQCVGWANGNVLKEWLGCCSLMFLAPVRLPADGE